MKRPTFEQAKARYVHRFTMEHVPAWARMPSDFKNCVRFPAPQFINDREWYDNTKFKGDEGWIGRGSDCYTTGQTWPLGKWLDKPFTRGDSRVA
jgi:hypothetical protein